jgi:epoxyqueuosine reductase
VIRGKLRELAEFLRRESPGCKARGIVDTAPLLERDFARAAGLGWFGKNTMLIHPRLGSFFFLGALLLSIPLEPDAPFEKDHCGTCPACLDACPTAAFPKPGVLDSTKCISYLTIELKGSVPETLRPGMGDWIFGCDICQDVCPWNRKAEHAREPTLAPSAPLPSLEALLTMDDAAFRMRFRGSAMTLVPAWPIDFLRVWRHRAIRRARCPMFTGPATA